MVKDGDYVGKMKYLPVFFDSRKMLSALTDEQFGRVIRAAMVYMEEGTEPDLQPIEMIGFQVIKEKAERSAAKYDETCAKNAENIRKRWASQNDTTVYDGIPSNTTVYDSIPSDTKNTKNKEERRKSKEERVKNVSCAEPEPSSAPAPENIVASLILNDGTLYYLTEDMAVEFERLYPAVNVRQEFRNMEGWCKNNAPKRKTRSGVKRFVNYWLAKEQNSPHPAVKSTGYQPQPDDDYPF